MSGSPAWHLAASGAMAGSRPAHPLSPALSGVNSSYFEEEEEEMSLLPPPGGPRSAPEHDAACSLQHGAWHPPLSTAFAAGALRHPAHAIWRSCCHPAGHSRSRPTHKKSFSNQFDSAVHTFQVRGSCTHADSQWHAPS